MPSSSAASTSAPFPALQPGSRILVTGATGFIGSHVADTLLRYGYNLLCPARSHERAAPLVEYAEQNYGKDRVEIVIIKDMGQVGCYDEVVKQGVQGVAHVAADVSFRPTWDETVEPTVAGVVSILSAAAKQPEIKRVVLCSSSTACGLPSVVPRSSFDPKNPPQHFDATTWDEKTPEVAKKLDAKVKAGEKLTPEEEGQFGNACYSTGKIYSEKAAWDFVKKEKPGFVLTTVQPNANWGKVLLRDGKASIPGDWIPELAKGDSNPFKIGPQWFVNPADVAEVHLQGLANPNVGNERVLAFTERIVWNEVIDIIEKHRPETKGHTTKKAQGDDDTIDGTDIDNRRFKQVVGFAEGRKKELMNLEESVVLVLDSLMPKK